MLFQPACKLNQYHSFDKDLFTSFYHYGNDMTCLIFKKINKNQIGYNISNQGSFCNRFKKNTFNNIDIFLEILRSMNCFLNKLN